VVNTTYVCGDVSNHDVVLCHRIVAMLALPAVCALRSSSMTTTPSSQHGGWCRLYSYTATAFASTTDNCFHVIHSAQNSFVWHQICRKPILPAGFDEAPGLLIKKPEALWALRLPARPSRLKARLRALGLAGPVSNTGDGYTTADTQRQIHSSSYTVAVTQRQIHSRTKSRYIAEV